MTTEDAQPAPETSPDEPVIAGAPSQMLARLLMGVILFGVVVSGAYIATRRSVTPAAPRPSVAAAPAPVAIQPAPQVVVAVAVPVAVPTPIPVPTPVPVPALAPAVTITPEETRGHTFIQVGAVETAAAPRFVRDLAAKGFTARIAEGPQPSVVRILVGPLEGPELTAMRGRLATAGIAAFPKAY